jgi:hypothetical protein
MTALKDMSTYSGSFVSMEYFFAFLETHALTVARRTCNALTFLTKLDDLIFFFKIKIHEKGMIGR